MITLPAGFDEFHKPGKFYYLASPYSAPDFGTRYKRFVEITKIAAELMVEYDLYLHTPITSSHELAKFIDGDSTFSFEYWKGRDLGLIDRSDAIIVACMDGWGQSIGVQAEIEYAKSKGLPVFYIGHLW